jgi:hypothetical protein
MSAWLAALGGGGIVAALGGITATFVRVGRLLQNVDDLGDRVSRIEHRQDTIINGRH